MKTFAALPPPGLAGHKDKRLSAVKKIFANQEQQSIKKAAYRSDLKTSTLNLYRSVCDWIVLDSVWGVKHGQATCLSVNVSTLTKRVLKQSSLNKTLLTVNHTKYLHYPVHKCSAFSATRRSCGYNRTTDFPTISTLALVGSSLVGLHEIWSPESGRTSDGRVSAPATVGWVAASAWPLPRSSCVSTPLGRSSFACSSDTSIGTRDDGGWIRRSLPERRRLSWWRSHVLGIRFHCLQSRKLVNPAGAVFDVIRSDYRWSAPGCCRE